MIKYNEELNCFAYENEHIILCWDEQPNNDFLQEVNRISECYKSNLLNIINFMLPDIQSMYGNVDINEVREKLGKPIIDLSNGQVTYCNHKLDDVHIFSFEFSDDDLTDLQYFSIDG